MLSGAGSRARELLAAESEPVSEGRCLDILGAIMADVHPLSGLDIYADVCLNTRAASSSPAAESYPPLPGAHVQCVPLGIAKMCASSCTHRILTETTSEVL